MREEGEENRERKGGNVLKKIMEKGNIMTKTRKRLVEGRPRKTNTQTKQG